MSTELAFAKELAIAAGTQSLAAMHALSRITSKDGVRDVVTNADTEIEEYIISAIRKKFPAHSVICEEGDDFGDSEYTWIIDPIDGTKYFADGIKLFTTSIGLWRGSEPLVGVIYNPATRDCYWAEKGEGAFVNDRRLRVSNRNTLAQGLVHLDIGNMRGKTDQDTDAYFATMRRIIEASYRCRILGVQALIYVAQGHFDVYYNVSGGLQLYDAGAGIVIAQEAGARLSNQRGEPITRDVRGLVVTNGMVHDQFLALINT